MVACEIAGTLARMFPDRPEARMCWAYATRRRSENGAVEAKRILLESAAKFPASHWICYNLGCYECQLGNTEATDLWLKRAFELDKTNEIKLAALEKEDFQPLWWKDYRRFDLRWKPDTKSFPLYANGVIG